MLRSLGDILPFFPGKMSERHVKMSGRHVKMSGRHVKFSGRDLDLGLVFSWGKMSEIHFEMSGRNVKVSQRHLGTCFPVIRLRDMLRCLGEMLRCLGNMLTFLKRLEYKLSELSPDLTRQQTRSCFQLTFSYCLPTCIACRDNALGMPTDPSALLILFQSG